jgi:hypothetical protein
MGRIYKKSVKTFGMPDPNSLMTLFLQKIDIHISYIPINTMNIENKAILISNLISPASIANNLT